MRTLSGPYAIDYALAHNLPLNRWANPYTNPVIPARKGITLEEARAVLEEDARLVYVEISPARRRKAKSGARLHSDTVKYDVELGDKASDVLAFGTQPVNPWGDTPIADIGVSRSGVRRFLIFRARIADFETACVRANIPFRRVSE